MEKQKDMFANYKKSGYKMMPNSEKMLRSLMIYCFVSMKLHCLRCQLFVINATDTTLTFVAGFKMWWKLSLKVNNHETAEVHLRYLEKRKTSAAEHRLHKTIYAEVLHII